MEYAKIEKAAEQATVENNAFLVELEVKPNNVIIAYVDADEVRRRRTMLRPNLYHSMRLSYLNLLKRKHQIYLRAQ